MKKAMSLLLALVMVLSLAACGSGGSADDNSSGTTLVYGSADYTRINPAMDEHGEINLLLFNGLTAHDGNDQIVPGLAETWDYDEQTYTYTFHLREGVKWHDGEPFTADDVKFTIEAIMDPENGSENAPNYEDVEEITIIDAQTVAFRLTEPNVAFLEYMTMGILPQHLLAGQDMQESDFFRSPVGTGPYKLESWDAGQSIVLVKNEDYYLGAPKIDRVIFKIVPDDIAQAAAQQIRAIGINCTVEIPAQMDWGGQMACLIGWGSPFDADDHTYKVFGTDKGANYSSYSNTAVDEALIKARQSDDPAVRKAYYADFQQALAADPAYAFICYIDANYVAKSNIKGIDTDTVLGHHGVGIFWNIQDWEIA